MEGLNNCMSSGLPQHSQSLWVGSSRIFLLVWLDGIPMWWSDSLPYPQPQPMPPSPCVSPSPRGSDSQTPLQILPSFLNEGFSYGFLWFIPTEGFTTSEATQDLFTYSTSTQDMILILTKLKDFTGQKRFSKDTSISTRIWPQNITHKKKRRADQNCTGKKPSNISTKQCSKPWIGIDDEFEDIGEFYRQLYGGFLKWRYPQIILILMGFPRNKPSTWGYPYFRNRPHRRSSQSTGKSIFYSYHKLWRPCQSKVHVNMVIPGYGGFHKIGLPQKWMVYWKNSIEIDDLGVPLFQETSIWKSG